jgi:hypothetical protein
LLVAPFLFVNRPCCAGACAGAGQRLKEGDDMKAFEATALIEATPEAIWALLTDGPAYW